MFLKKINMKNTKQSKWLKHVEPGLSMMAEMIQVNDVTNG